jgi:hypothetical protein
VREHLACGLRFRFTSSTSDRPEFFVAYLAESSQFFLHKCFEHKANSNFFTSQALRDGLVGALGLLRPRHLSSGGDVLRVHERHGVTEEENGGIGRVGCQPNAGTN